MLLPQMICMVAHTVIFTKIFEAYGIEFSFTDMTQLDQAEKLIKPSTKLIWIETPTNPTLTTLDIKACAQLAKKVQSSTCSRQHVCFTCITKPNRFGRRYCYALSH